MSGSKNFWNLLQRKLTGSIGEMETRKLDQWLDDHPSDRRTANTVEKAWDLSSAYKTHYQPDVPAGLQRLKKRIAAENVNQTPHLQVVSRSFFPTLLRIAAAVLLTMGAAYLYTFYTSNHSSWTFAAAMDGEKEKIVLPDGSEVWVNENSILEFPQQFASDHRSLRLNGEAFFKVQKDASRPFLIETEQTIIRVLGTSFNVRALGSEAFTEVVVQSGKVQFRSKKEDDSQTVLTANQKAIYDHQTGRMENEVSSDLNEMAWQTTRLRFAEKKMADVISDLERFFEVQIKVSDEKLLDCPYTNAQPGNNIDDILFIMAESLNWQRTQIDSNTYLLTGTKCN